MLSLFMQKKGFTSVLNSTRRHFAIWCIKSSVAIFFLIALDLPAEDVVFTGKLVRKYYQHLIPQAVEKGVFGWFLELDSFSRAVLQEKICELNTEDRQCCAKFAFDPSIVQLCLSGADDRQQCRNFEGKRVEVSGEWPSSPHIFRPIPSYQVHLANLKPIEEDVVELSGVLTCKIFPGPPNYDSIEDGDYPEMGWILKLDDRSKGKLVPSIGFGEDEMDGEIAVETTKQYEDALQQCTNRNVICLGSFQSAESAHHPTSFLLRSCKLIAVPQSQ